VTLKRVWGSLSFWNKLKMASEFIAALFMNETIDEKLIEEMKEHDQLENILTTFAVSFPQVKSTLIDERDVYLAQKIRSAPGQKVVAVVGAGHIRGILNHIKNPEPIDRLITLPPKSVLPAVIGWSIPACILILFVAGFFKGGFKYSMDFVYLWIIVTGTFSAIGAAVALAHPLTIIASFVAAPFTTLNPMIAVGMVSGLVQAMVKKPTVKDMEDLHNAITSVKGFWTNPATRILLVFVTANLGGSLGTFVAGSWIAGKLF
jgi:pheromone shutdown-related protein TraB